MALNIGAKRVYRQTHSSPFNADAAKLTLGVAADKLAAYKERAQFLASKQAKHENVVEFFKRILPVQSNNKTVEVKKDISKNAREALNLLETQPGANFAPGTWWNAYNAFTYYADHMIGKSADRRLTNAWYGQMAARKIKALELAVELAELA